MKKLILILCFIFESSYAADVIHSAKAEPLDVNDIDHITSIFTRKITRWNASGNRITVFIKPMNSIEHRVFVFEWLGITNYRYKKLLQQNTFSGSASSVKVISSDEQMASVVRTTPNSIGYINDQMVINNDSEITILSISN